jgi:hypothetical protein
MQAPHHRSRLNFLDSLRADSTFYVRQDELLCPRPCECPDCGNSFFSLDEQTHDRFIYTSKISDSDAQRLLSTYVKQMMQDRAYLLEQCRTRGDQIITRWKKRTQQKRAAVLLNADPDLCRDQFFIPTFHSMQSPWKETRVAKLRNTYLHPYLSVEVLEKNPALLFGLLHYRSHFSPQDWAAYDSKVITLGWASGAFDVDFNASSVIMYGERYGTLTPWNADQMHRADTLGYPRARLVLEAQSALLRLLRRIVEILLEAGNNTPAESSRWNEMVMVGFKKSEDRACWSRFAYQPFSPPPRLDVNNMLAQAKARMDATGDHLWLLQTEPAYLRYFIRSVKEMTITKAIPSDAYSWQMILGEITGDYRQHIFWSWVHDELTHASQLYPRYRDSINQGTPLPRSYDDIIGALELLIVNQIHTRSMHLQLVLSFRPGFAHYVDVRYKAGDVVEITSSPKYPAGPDGYFNTDPLYWCLLQLQGPPDSQTRFEYAMMFNFLDEHLAKAPKEERSRLDAVLYEKLSDYSVLVEMLATIRLARPQNRNRDLSQTKNHDDRRAWRNSKHDLKITKSLDTAKALQEFYNTPMPGGGKDQNWIQGFDAVHEKLQAFWQKLHRELEQCHAKTQLSPEDVQANLKPIQMWSSPEHLRLVERRREDVRSKLNRPKPATDFDVFLPLPRSTSDPCHIPTTFPPAKEKPKTRGTSAVPPTPAVGPPLSPIETLTITDPHVLSLPRKSLTALRTMFPSTPEERAKTIDWDAFVTALTDAGFAARNAGGSMVAFERDDGKIVFHKPHPVAKIEPIVLQSMGRRMNRWFGWCRESFVGEK